MKTITDMSYQLLFKLFLFNCIDLFLLRQNNYPPATRDVVPVYCRLSFPLTIVFFITLFPVPLHYGKTAPYRYNTDVIPIHAYSCLELKSL